MWPDKTRGELPVMPKGRYAIMLNYMPKVGSLGLDMMLRTCTVQANLDYRDEADNQRAFAKAYEGHPHFVVPHIVASAPKVVIQEWIDGIPMSQIIREGTGADRQLSAWERTQDMKAVVDHIVVETYEGLALPQ